MPYIEDLDSFDYENQLQWDRDWDQKIWRYLDIEQFLSLMHRSSLRFGRADLFADDLEGTVPSASALPQNLHTIYRRAPEITNISCWHKARAESMTMWEVYSDRGIVIESTPRKLRNSLCDKRKFAVQFTDVQYLDYTSDSFEFFERKENGGVRGNYVEPFQFKREYYKGEEEFRAITGPLASEEFRSKIEQDGQEKDDWDEIVDQHKIPGIFVTVDLEKLINSVVISPYASAREYEMAKELAERKHGLGDRVELSDIRTTTMVARYRRKK